MNTQSFKTALLAFLAAGTVLFALWPELPLIATPQPQSAGGGGTTVLRYVIDRSLLPDLNYNQLTIDLQTNGAQVISVRENEPDTPFTIMRDVAYTQPDTNTVRVNTTGTLLEVTIDTPSNSANLGDFSVPTLKDDKAFAFSVGFDDNTNLQPAIDLMSTKGWRGTLYLIGQYVNDLQPNEEWIITHDDVQNLVEQGWAMGNHTWDHYCPTPLSDQTIRDAHEHLRTVIDGSSVPNYRINSFAAPCFDEGYHPLILNLRDNEPTIELLFNESGGPYIMQVDSNATSVAFQYNGTGVGLFDLDGPVGRDPELSSAPAKIDALVAEYNNSGSHFWYNVLQHGNGNDSQLTADELQPAIDRIYDQYGPGSSNDIAWVAPAEEIYSYLLLRAKSTIYFSQHIDPTATPTLDPNAPTPTATPTYTPTATPTPTQDPASPPDEGIVYRYYDEVYLSSDPVLQVPRDWINHNLTSIDTLPNFNVDINDPSKPNYYGIRFTGCVGVPFDADYTFYVTSDDASLLTINGQTVVENDGKVEYSNPHAPREASGTVALTSGWHEFEVGYIQMDYLTHLSVEFEGPGLARQAIPDANLGCRQPQLVPTPGPTAIPTATPTSTPDPNIPTLPTSGMWYGLYEEWLNESDFTANFDWSQRTLIASGTKPTFDFNVNNPGRDSHYQVRYLGCIGIPSDGLYTFYVTSDDGTALFINNELVVDNIGKVGPSSGYGPREASGTITLTPDWHEFELKYNQFDGGRALTVEYEGPGVARQVVPNGVLGCQSGPVPTPLPIPTAAPTPPPAATPTATPNPNDPAMLAAGIWYGLYEEWLGDADFTPAFDWNQRSLVASGTLGNFDYAVNNDGRSEHYQVRYVGCIGIPTDGTYSFHITSDDGAHLFINNQLVLSNSGKVAWSQQYTPFQGSGSMSLPSGYHEFELKYNQFDWNRTLVVEYEGPGVARQPIPDSAFGCGSGPVPTPVSPTPTPGQPNSPLPTPTAASNSPLPAPTATPEPEISAAGGAGGNSSASVPAIVSLETSPLSNLRVSSLSISESVQELSASEKEARWLKGLPVPFREVVVDENQQYVSMVQAAGSQNIAPNTQVMNTYSNFVVNNWLERDTEDFEQNFSNGNGDCTWERSVTFTEPAYMWGRAQAQDGRNAIWPAGDFGSESSTGFPFGTSYPKSMNTSFICRLSNTADLKNIVTEFNMWYQLADGGDGVSLSFFNGELENNNPVYNGLVWRGVDNNPITADWSQYRIYLPELNGHNEIWVRWNFFSDDRESASGPWIDDINISTYTKPESSVNCQINDEKFAIQDADGNSFDVSKGLNLPPYNEHFRSDLGLGMDGAMINNLVDADVDWVRLEFLTERNGYVRALTNSGLLDAAETDQFGQIDLRHYDILIDSLCAQGISVLGLVDNQSLTNTAWRGSSDDDPLDNEVTAAYLNQFTSTVSSLANYFDDRIKYWEVWNEPNNAEESYLPPAEYAELLQATYDTIKVTYIDDIVVSGGTGGIDIGSQTYFEDLYEILEAQNPFTTVPFDIIGLHPYRFRIDGQVAVDPKVYLRHQENPTILEAFKDKLIPPNGRDPGKEIWATELGWNSALNSRTDDVVASECNGMSEELISRAAQAQYLSDSFRILFEETEWSLYGNAPGVTKIFWYQYQDTTIIRDRSYCSGSITAAGLLSPSSADSVYTQLLIDDPIRVNWEWGLFDSDLKPTKPVLSAFRSFPDTPIYNYLPFISNEGQPSISSASD